MKGNSRLVSFTIIMGALSWFWLRMMSEIFALVLVGSVAIGLFFAKPYRRGFFLNDTSLSYPYRSSTIPTIVVGLVAPCTAGVTIVIVELVRGKLYGFKRRFRGAFMVGLCVYKYVYLLILGFAITAVFVNVGKVVIGRLRPHFFAVCQPKNFIAQADVYITEYECGGTNTKLLEDVRLSFPSGHAGFSMFVAAFIAIYLYYRVPRKDLGVAIRNFLQVTAIATGTYVAITRISDYKHHPTDVLAGILIGTLVAVYTLVYASQKDEFHEEEEGEEEEEDDVIDTEVTSGEMA